MSEQQDIDAYQPPPSTTVIAIGVLEFNDYQRRVLPLLDKAKQAPTRAQAILDLRTMAQSIGDKNRREEALTHIDRLDGSLQNSRWNRNAAGQIIESMCVHRIARIPDHINDFRNLMEFLYKWNADHAETLYVFLAHLSDRTLLSATSPEAWRVVLDPSEVVAPAEACRNLTHHDLKKMLENAEGGAVYSPEEALEMSEWWREFRTIIQAAAREENGIFLCVR
jgi:hypothetical protein